MLDVLAAIRDIVIILAAVTIATVAVIVGRAVLGLTRRAEDLRLFVVDVATGVANPIKGVSLGIGRIVRGLRQR